MAFGRRTHYRFSFRTRRTHLLESPEVKRLQCSGKKVYAQPKNKNESMSMSKDLVGNALNCTVIILMAPSVCGLLIGTARIAGFKAADDVNGKPARAP